MRVQARRCAAVLLFAILCIGYSPAQDAVPDARNAAIVSNVAAEQQPSAPRIILKLRGAFAAEVEKSLPVDSMTLSPAAGGDRNVQRFLNEHSARQLAPLYPALVRAKLQRHVSEAQITQGIRNRFAARARRFRGEFNPPEISRTYVLELSENARMPTVLSRLNADPNVEWAEEDHIDTAIYTPNDPYFSSYGSWGQSYDDLWGTKIIGAPAAWDTTRGDGIVIAVVDTGVDLSHPDIAANLWTNPKEIAGNGIDDDGNGYVDDVYGWDFIGATYQNPVQSNNPVDGFGHGTHVAGTIAAVGDNGTGIVGVAWHAHVMAVKGLDNNGYGFDSTLANAITYAANNGADVISNSWGGKGSSQTIADAVSYAYNLGAVVVVAAGNNNDDARNYYPANLWDVITVAATQPPSYGYEGKAYFSNWGSKIDVGAPGVDILSLRAAGTSMGKPVDAYYTRADGTSMATPHVSGTAALILAQHPEYSNEDVRQVLRVSSADTGTAGFDLDFGYGRINAAAALTVTDVLEAKISGPADGTHVKVPTTISGVARGNTFSSYVLEYGAGHLPTSWTTIQSAASPVAGALGVFDPSSLADGVYVIRLTAYNSAGQAFVDRIELIVDYSSITSPAPPNVPSVAAEYKPGAAIPIVGTANGGSFQNFIVEWAEGINPSTGWNASGVTLAGGGTAPITNDVLATWDTSGITQADYYTVRLTINNSGYSSYAFTMVYLEPDLLSGGWPKWLDQAPYFSSGLVPALDGNGNLRLTLVDPLYANTTLPARYWSLAPDGSNLYTETLYYGDYFQPAAADFDSAPGQESIVAEADKITVFHSDNTSTHLTAGLPVYINFQYGLPVLADLNGDSKLEVVAVGRSYSTSMAYVFAWRPDGQQLNSNFPIALSDQNSNVSYSQGARVLAGDIDGDGQRELITQEGPAASTFTLRLFAADGSPKAWSNPSFNGYPTNMALADLDHNGTLEIILLVTANSVKSVHVLQPDGTERPGWPVALSSANTTVVAVGDLNRDGREQIVVVSNNGSIYAFNSDGTSLSSVFPINPPNSVQTFAGLALADVDGDGYAEIVTIQEHMYSATNPLLPQISLPQPTVAADGAVTSDSPRVDVPGATAYPSKSYDEPTLLAIRRDGTTWKSWRLLGANGNQPFFEGAISVGDFNQDGRTDIGVVYFTVSGGGISGYLNEGVATVLTTGNAFVPANNDWPMAFRNPRNTALLQRDFIAPNVAITSPTGGVVTGTVPVSISASDNDVVNKVEFYVDDVLRATGATAAFNLNWDTSAETSGTHSLTAKAYDDSGNVGTSAPVQVKVDHSPSVAITDPADGSVFPASANITLAASASDADGSISRVEFFQGSTSLGAVTASPYTVVWNNVPLGTYTLTAVATDNDGISTQSAPISITVATGAPTLSPSSLAFGNQYVGKKSGGKTVKLTANGPGALAISAISVTSGFVQTNNCPASLNQGSSCNISVSFAPQSAGPTTGTLSITDNALGSPQTVALTGNGLDFAVSVLPSSVSVAAGEKAMYSVTVSALGGTYSNNVALSCSNLPKATKCSFSPSGIVPGSTSAKSTLTVTTTAGSTGTPVGSYTITVSGTANNTTHSATTTLVVN